MTSKKNSHYQSALYLHGSLPLLDEGLFLKEVCSDLYRPSLLSKDTSLSSITAHLNHNKIPLLCGYSLGGRVLLSLLPNLSYSPKLVVLMACAWPLFGEQERQQRLAKDTLHAKEIENDFESFIEKWYRADLWALDQQRRQRLQDCYVKEYDTKQKRRQLSQLFLRYCQGTFPRAEAKSIKKFPFPCLYMSGGLDEKYTAQAASFASHFSSFEHFIIPQAGHKLHLETKQQHLINSKIRISS